MGKKADGRNDDHFLSFLATGEHSANDNNIWYQPLLSACSNLICPRDRQKLNSTPGNDPRPRQRSQTQATIQTPPFAAPAFLPHIYPLYSVISLTVDQPWKMSTTSSR